MATIQEILDKINASKSNNINNNSFIDLMRQISGNPEDAIQPVNDTNSIYGHIVQMYTTLYDSGVDYAILADEVDMLQGVYDNLIAINSVHEDKTKLDSLYTDKTKLDQLFADKAIIDRVYGSITNIDRVHTSIDKLDTVYASVLKMDTVADNIADVNIVADSMTVLNEIYDNRVEIYAADNNATVATTKAIEASNSATIATTKASEASASVLAASTASNTSTTKATESAASAVLANTSAGSASNSAASASSNAAIATTKASEASVSASNASTSAANASTSASAASVSASTSTTKATEAATSAATALGYKNDVSAMKLAVETIYDTFEDRFLGTKIVDPTLDNDGNALLDGAMYFNTSSNAMKVYDIDTTTWYSIPQIYLSALLDVELTSISTGNILVWNGTKWANHTLTKADVGLNLADNTSDATKNVLSATKLATARTINGISFDGSANITTYDSTKVAKVTSTDNAVVRFNGTTGEVQNSLVTIDDAGNQRSARLICTGTGNDYGTGALEVNGNRSTVVPTIGFHQPGSYGGSLQQVSSAEFSFFTQGGVYYASLKNNINMQNAINVNGSVRESILTSNVIVESGSNANGSYTKFADGSRLEYKNISCAATANARYIEYITWPVSGPASGTGCCLIAVSGTYSYTVSQPPAFNASDFYFVTDTTQTYAFVLTRYTP